MPVALCFLGASDEFTFKMRLVYAGVLYEDGNATLDDIREAVTSLEDLERTMRRVLGGAHPLVSSIEAFLRKARATLRARETPSGSP